MQQQQQHLLNLIEPRSGGSSWTREKYPHGWPACLRWQPPRVAFKNNDIYMVNDEEANSYEELRERHPKVQYKLKICNNPASKNMPHEEEYDDDNYESIDEMAV